MTLMDQGPVQTVHEPEHLVLPLDMGPPIQAKKTRGLSAKAVAAGAAIGVFALAAGVGIGYMSQAGVRDDLSQAQSEIGRMTTSMDELTASVNSAELQAAACQKAAAASYALIGQWNNFWQDELAWWDSEPGSAAEADLDSHMTAQEDQMRAQEGAVTEMLAACPAGGAG